MKNYKLIIIFVITLLILFLAYKKVIPYMEAKKAFQKAKNDFDILIVANAERIFRLETNNFLSNQFTGTYSPGMEPAPGVTSYPYGWNSLKDFWDDYPEYKPTGLKVYTENGTGIKKPFICFPSVEAAVYTLCMRLVNMGNNPGKWYSNAPAMISAYNNKIAKIDASFTYA